MTTSKNQTFIEIFFNVHPLSLLMQVHTYPWNGEFVTGNPESPAAVVTLAVDLDLSIEKVAIHGKMKTENLGIEKVVANVISNPNIRFLIVFGEDIRGHRAGGSLIALHKFGLEESRRIRNAPGAVPYIENIDDDAVERFRNQVEIIDLLGITDREKLEIAIHDSWERNQGNFGEPHIAIQVKTVVSNDSTFLDSLSLHRSLMISPFLEISLMERTSEEMVLHSSIKLTTRGRIKHA